LIHFYFLSFFTTETTRSIRKRKEIERADRTRS